MFDLFVAVSGIVTMVTQESNSLLNLARLLRLVQVVVDKIEKKKKKKKERLTKNYCCCTEPLELSHLEFLISPLQFF